MKTLPGDDEITLRDNHLAFQRRTLDQLTQLVSSQMSEEMNNGLWLNHDGHDVTKPTTSLGVLWRDSYLGSFQVTKHIKLATANSCKFDLMSSSLDLGRNVKRIILKWYPTTISWRIRKIRWPITF